MDWGSLAFIAFLSIYAPFLILPVTSTYPQPGNPSSFSRGTYKDQSLKTRANLHLRTHFIIRNICNALVVEAVGMCCETPSRLFFRSLWVRFLILTWWKTVLCFLYSWPRLEFLIFVSFIFPHYLNILMSCLSPWWWALGALESHGICSLLITSYDVLPRFYFLTVSTYSFFPPLYL